MKCIPLWPVVVAAVAVTLCPAALAADAVFPNAKWEDATPADAGLDEARLHQARDYALAGAGSGVVIRGGRVVMAWGDTRTRYDLKSTTKSFGATALGVAILDGKVKLDEKAADHHPAFGVPPESNRETRWLGDITLFHLASQTAGFEKPGGYGKLLFRPGSKWHYSDAGPNWLAECLTLAYRRDIRDVMFERVFTPIGITEDDLTWRKNQYRPHEIDGVPRREFGAGISANVEAMARLGYLYLRGGRWRDRQILPADFVQAAGRTPARLTGLPEHELPGEHGNASDHYGLLWWNNADGTLPAVPRDAYWSWGLYDSIILVVPSLDLVVARAGKIWPRERGGGHYDVLRPFFDPLVAAVRKPGAPEAPEAPAPPAAAGSRRIERIEWAPPETIVRRAKGSDNWPMTWGDDDHLYTAYGDGWGFEPRVPEKLSMGFARITGGPTDFAGENIRSDAETKGDGPRGRKASGILMVDGVLYLWVRNAGNAQLAWSGDKGKSWTWADWKFETSFGCPTFVNYGRNYDGAVDGYVYTVSPDANDAYTPADRFVLARVLKERIANRDAWEFFAGAGNDGHPQWTSDVARRGGVLERRGGCSRSGVIYVPGLERYLWVVTLPTARGGAEGSWSGLAVYESPQPWGPWTCVYEADPWDIHPGDSASFPSKWVSPDGRGASLVFAGDDSFAVRRATFVLADEKKTAVTAEDAAARQEAVRAQIERYLDREIQRAGPAKDAAWQRDFSSAEAYEKSVDPWRKKLFDMIGGDAYPQAPLEAKEELIGEFQTHRAYRVWISVFDGVQAYGVLLVPTAPPPPGGGRPALVCVHGMSGTPESLCGLLEKPDYHKNLGARAAARGYVVFAPSNVNNYKTRSWLDRKAVLVGQRMQALEQRKLMRVVDYLAARPDVDPKRVGAYGISWGGRTVMYGAALDKRFAACAISGHFNELVPKMVTPSPHYTAFIETGEDYAFFWNNFRLFDETDVVSLICPRPVLIEQGRHDRVVHWEMSRRAFGRVKETYEKLRLGDRAVYSLFEGVHEMHGEEALAFFDRYLK